MKITRFNAWAELENCSSGFLDNLVRHLSVPVEIDTQPGFRFGVMWSYEGERYGSLVRGRIVPAGLVPHVQALAAHYREPCEIHDARVRPPEQYPLYSVSAKWRPYQDVVHRQIVAHASGVVDAAPRSGKTLMAARACDAYNVPTVYVAPTVQIVRQTYEVFVKYFGEDSVSRLDGDAAPHEKDPEKRFVIATAPSAVAMPSTWWERRDMLIIDEFHHAAADTYHRINALAHRTYYRYGWTGTHFRTGDDRLAMEAVCSYLLMRIPSDYLIDNGWLVPPHVFFIPVRSKGTGGSDWRKAYQKGIVDCEMRNDLVANFARTMLDNGIPTIVLTRRRKHADLLGERIPDSVVVKGGENALTSDAVRGFLEGRSQCLVGTTVIGEGVDVPRAGALVYASGHSDGVSMMQSYYRPLTASPGKSVGRIYDFIDYQHGTLLKHSMKRIEMAKEQLGAHRVFAAS